MKKKYVIYGLVFICGFILISLFQSVIGEEKEDTSEKATYTFENKYANIYFYEDSSNVVITQSPDDKIYLNINKDKVDDYKIEDRTDLIIKNNGGENILDMLLFKKSEEQKTELLIPKNSDLTLLIENNDGDIEINDQELETLKVDGNNSDITLHNNNIINDITLDNEGGNIEMNETMSRNNYIENEDGNITIKTGNSNFTSVVNEKGDINIDGLYSNTDINIFTNKGNIDCKNIEFERLLKGRVIDGNIIIDLPNPENNYTYNLLSKSGTTNVNNNVNYRNNSGAKIIELTSVDGNIDIKTTN